eukprot:TRINITY_DN2948_c0_g1_i2.p1 TRINITY_DN2948_c0_g1~~TRINITY_DN2948_c0_g1_i2.p1  ORF type:complete len:739 (-),score=134.93 TRINITY_DN2948_c0_g1_i2:418-2310(-)
MTKTCMAVLNAFMKLDAYQTGICRTVLLKRLYANEIRSTTQCSTLEEETLCAKVFYPYKKLLQEMRCMCAIQVDYMYSYGQRNKETDVCTLGFEEIPDVHYLEHCFSDPKPQTGYHLFHKPDFTCVGNEQYRFYEFYNRFAVSRPFLKDEVFDAMCYSYSKAAKMSLPPLGEDCEDVPVPYHPLTCAEIASTGVCDSIDTEMYCRYSCAGCSVAVMPYQLDFCNTTVHDCECVQGEWLYDIDNDGEPEVHKGCVLSADEDKGYWCPIGHPGTCTDAEKTYYRTYEFCYPETCARKPAVSREIAKENFTDVEICATTMNLCECEPKWKFDLNLDGKKETYSGCAEVPQLTGSWCKYTDSETCRNPERIYYQDLGIDYCYEEKNCTHLKPEAEMKGFRRFPTFKMLGEPCTPPCLKGDYPSECKELDSKILSLQQTDQFCEEISSEEILPFQELGFDCPTYGICQIRTETLVKLKMRNGCFCYKKRPSEKTMCDSITGSAEQAMGAWEVSQEFCDDREANVPIEEFVPEPEPVPVPVAEPTVQKPKPAKKPKKKEAEKVEKKPKELDLELTEEKPKATKEDKPEEEDAEILERALTTDPLQQQVSSSIALTISTTTCLAVLGLLMLTQYIAA